MIYFSVHRIENSEKLTKKVSSTWAHTTPTLGNNKNKNLQRIKLYLNFEPLIKVNKWADT